jgi:Lrp/AsnC family leucine-responsive transcriptional regulator
MKANRHSPEFDSTDRAILELLQENCKQPLAAIGDKVGLSAPSVAERIHKLEEAGVITGYAAQLDARRLGKDVTAFIGVSAEHPRTLRQLEREMVAIDEVLESHLVTGAYTLMLKPAPRRAWCSPLTPNGRVSRLRLPATCTFDRQAGIAPAGRRSPKETESNPRTATNTTGGMICDRRSQQDPCHHLL